MILRRSRLAFVVLAGLVGLAGCPDNPYKASTWTKKLGDPKEGERAVTELEQLGDPDGIEPLGKAWASQGKPVRLLQVIISLSRAMSPAEAKEKFFTDYEEKGREAHWDKALPFLKQALDEVDETNPRSVDSAQKAAGALGESRLAEGLESLITMTGKPSTKKIIAAQIDAVRAMGKYDNEKAKATAALEKILEREPPDHPKTGKDKAESAALGEKYGLFLGIAGAAINAVGELHNPSATATLVKALYRSPELFTQTRRALVALGPQAEDALRQVLAGKYAPVNELFVSKKYDMYCGDKNDLKGDQCRPVSAKDFYPAVVLGDFYDPKVVPDLLAALQRPPLPVYYQDKNPSPNTQHNAIFDALRKIGSADAATTVRNLWMAKSAAPAPAPKAPKGAPAKEAAPAVSSFTTKILAVSTYPFLTRDTQGIKELGVIAATNKEPDGVAKEDWEEMRQEAATAFARLATSKADIDVLLILSKKYLDESNKKKTEAETVPPKGKVSPKAEADASDKEYAAAKKANDDAKAAALKATHDPSLTIPQIKETTAKAKETQLAFDVAKDEHTLKTGTYKRLEGESKAYKAFARMFQTHAARIAVAIRCGNKLKCYAETLKLKPDDSVKNLTGLIKDEADKPEDLTKWTKEEKLGLWEGEVERAMLELGKAGPAAAEFTETLLDAAKSDDRLVRQSILLALPKIAKVPCNDCEAKLDAAIRAGEGKVTLGDLNLETTMLRNYFAWAGGKTPTKTNPEDAAPAEKAPAEKPADKDAPAEKAPEEKPADKKPADAKPADAKPDPKAAKPDPKAKPAKPDPKAKPKRK